MQVRLRVRLVVVVWKKSLGAGADTNNTKIMCAVVHYLLLKSAPKIEQYVAIVQARWQGGPVMKKVDYVTKMIPFYIIHLPTYIG